MKKIDIRNGKWKNILILTEKLLGCGLRGYLLFISYKHGCFRSTLIDKEYSKDFFLIPVKFIVVLVRCYVFAKKYFSLFLIRSTTDFMAKKKKYVLLLISFNKFFEMISRANGLNFFKVNYNAFHKELQILQAYY